MIEHEKPKQDHFFVDAKYESDNISASHVKPNPDLSARIGHDFVWEWQLMLTVALQRIQGY